MWIFLNDRFVRAEEAVVSVFDHGFLYGDGVYETIRSYGPRIFMRDQHLARLRRSAEAIGIEIPIPPKDWPGLLHEAMERNAVGNEQADAYLRITVTRGEGEIGLDPSLCRHPTVVIVAKALAAYPPHLYRDGARLIIAQTRRLIPAHQVAELPQQHPGEAGSDSGGSFRQRHAELAGSLDRMHDQ